MNAETMRRRMMMRFRGSRTGGRSLLPLSPSFSVGLVNQTERNERIGILRRTNVNFNSSSVLYLDWHTANVSIIHTIILRIGDVGKMMMIGCLPPRWMMITMICCVTPKSVVVWWLPEFNMGVPEFLWLKLTEV